MTAITDDLLDDLAAKAEASPDVVIALVAEVRRLRAQNFRYADKMSRFTRAINAELGPAVIAAKAEAWDEGYRTNGSGHANPYRNSDDHR